MDNDQPETFGAFGAPISVGATGVINRRAPIIKPDKTTTAQAHKNNLTNKRLVRSRLLKAFLPASDMG